MRRIRLDWPYLLALLGLVSISLVMVFSATDPREGASGALKQLVALPVLLVGWLVPPDRWRRAAPALLVISLLALLGLKVLPAPLVVRVGDSTRFTRWYRVPGIGQVQPSEFAKLAYVLFAANLLDRRGRRMAPRDWATLLGVTAAVAGLIYLEPDLGTALVVAGTAVFMLVAAGVRWRPILTLVLAGVVVVTGLAWSSRHQRERLLAYWNPWAHAQEGGHQVIQGWEAMAQGGWFGVGIGRSLRKDEVPEGDTDFLFAVLTAESGVAGGVLVIGLLGLLVWRGYTVSMARRDRFTALVVAGLTSWIAVQSVLNLGVVTGVLPNTGVPLPFLSRGVSSLAALLLGAGMVLRAAAEPFGGQAHRLKRDRRPPPVHVS